MVLADRGDHRRGRLRDDVRRVGAPAEADFEQEHVRGRLREEEESGGGGDLEDGDRGAAVHRLATAQGLDEARLVDEASAAEGAEADALVEAHEMRRGVDVHGEPGRFEDRAHEGDRRALAVRAGDVDRRRQPPVRAAERVEKTLDAAERQVDRLRMQGEKARDQRVGGAHPGLLSDPSAIPPPAAGAPAAWATAAPS